jgi:uncharacterized membrane protein YphA (DoxX/SURF4 family)
MLQLFPLQFLTLIAIALLRFFLGWVVCRLGYQLLKHPTSTAPFFCHHHLNRRWFILAFGFFECLIGILLMAGFLTQAAALGAIAGALFMLRFRAQSTPGVTAPLPEPLTLAFIVVTATFLFIAGPGVPALDLPL